MANYLGFDNGTTANFGILTPNKIFYSKMPTFSVLNYQKTKAKNITRISTVGLEEIITAVISDEPGITSALIERPMVNPKFFDSTLSAVRALEAVLVVLERLRIGYSYCDSKEWQKEFIPGYQRGQKNADLKLKSLEIGKRMYPQIDWINFQDADGILIASYLKKHWDYI